MIVLFILAGSSIVLSLMFGAVKVGFSEVTSIVTGNHQAPSHSIIWNIRLPRVLIAGLVGMGMALSGTILQGVLRNPMADPHVIGVSSGAGLMGVGIILVYPEHREWLVPAAFVGAVSAGTMIYRLAWKNGVSSVRLILAGVAVSAFLNSGISGLLTFYSDRVEGALSFMVGSLSAKSWPDVQQLFPYTVIGAVIALLSGRWLNVLLLGDGIAKSLGLRVEGLRLFMISLASVLAASAVSVVGLLGFVGLIVPHLTRILVGNNYRIVLPCAALIGIIVLETADLLSRMIFAPVELPVGIVMGIMGAPIFLYLLRSKRTMS
ncbi:FecCD family ABC transporter permease [Paenibacillus terrae]|uniref:FecCD family ABC transporter permease n=1 Tax=Paenibacillus terrae TaxID=159743 RepID=UPI000ADF7F8E|nr:iron ABC transporter permease [Paenibacillus terrae]